MVIGRVLNQHGQDYPNRLAVQLQISRSIQKLVLSRSGAAEHPDARVAGEAHKLKLNIIETQNFLYWIDKTYSY